MSSVQLNRRRQMQGSQVSNLINPKQQIPTKNHILLNKKQVKEKQRPVAPSGESMFLSSPLSTNKKDTQAQKMESRRNSKDSLDSKESKDDPPTKDFIKLNKKITPKQKQAEPLKKIHPTGQIPTYLVNRKATLAKQEQERLEALSKCHIPPGMRIMNDQERAAQIESLEKGKAFT